MLTTLSRMSCSKAGEDAGATAPPATQPPTQHLLDHVEKVSAPPTETSVLTIALAAELKQLDGVLVVINSAASHAADAARLRFRILTTQEQAESLVAKVKERPEHLARHACQASSGMAQNHLEGVR